jgi:uncharacterized protein (TIGR03086 family)
MNIVTMHVVTEDFASHLSEVTDGDLKQPTPCAGWTVGDLYRHVVEENTKFGHSVSGIPVPFAATTDFRDAAGNVPALRMGGGFDEIYRESARYMEHGFAAIDDPEQLRQVAGVPGERQVAELFEMQIADTLIHTWDLARAVEIDYTPRPEIADLVLRRMRSVPEAARGEGKPFGAARVVPDTEELTTLDRLLLLSGRDIVWRPALSSPQEGSLFGWGASAVHDQTTEPSHSAAPR